MRPELARPGAGAIARWHAPSLAAAGAIALGATLLGAPAVERMHPPAPAELRVVFGEELVVVGGIATLQRAPAGRVAVTVGGIRQPAETYRVAGRRLLFGEPPAQGEKVVVDYAY